MERKSFEIESTIHILHFHIAQEVEKKMSET